MVTEVQIHKVKILRQYFDAILAGKKRCEIRYNDRNYRLNDILVLQKHYINIHGEMEEMQGQIVCRITHIDTYEQKPSYVVLSIEPLYTLDVQQ